MPESPSPSPSVTPAEDKIHSGNPTTSNLYLVTFLATLFLLLFVSCAIVLRSFILRRRYQRYISGLVDDVVVTPRTQGSRKRRLGIRPKFHDAWIENGGPTWNDMMPLAAVKQTKHWPSPSPPPEPPIRFLTLLNRPPPAPQPTENPPPKVRHVVQVAVLVAMPVPNRSSSSSIDKKIGAEDEEIPEVALGVTRILYKYNT
ncbi:hypothetical protein BD779DRAFT_1499310 [Infundibulicybe gibba]|nr:hypothetical protein BD779DRAFT_1499310 [Infundibulicybe gibba]